VRHAVNDVQFFDVEIVQLINGNAAIVLAIQNTTIISSNPALDINSLSTSSD